MLQTSASLPLALRGAAPVNLAFWATSCLRVPGLHWLSTWPACLISSLLARWLVSTRAAYPGGSPGRLRTSLGGDCIFSTVCVC